MKTIKKQVFSLKLIAKTLLAGAFLFAIYATPATGDEDYDYFKGCGRKPDKDCSTSKIHCTKEEIDKLETGQILKVEADDPAAEEDIKQWARIIGHDILKFEKHGTMLTFYIKKN